MQKQANATMIPVKHFILSLLSIVLLSACCAPSATHTPNETAFKATVLTINETTTLVELDNGQTLELLGLDFLLVEGQRYYIQGVLLTSQSVDVTNIADL